MENTNCILEYLSRQDEAVTEYQLLCFIEDNELNFFPPNNDFSLFKKHFFLFHHLYRLNEILLEKKLCLTISALEIKLNSIETGSDEIGFYDSLASFYLDPKNLNLSDQEIENMLQLFWQKYAAVDDKAKAIKTLGLEHCSALNKKIIKKKYNQLAKTHHPDKGGNKDSFVRIKQAYDLLILFF